MRKKRPSNARKATADEQYEHARWRKREDFCKRESIDGQYTEMALEDPITITALCQ